MANDDDMQNELSLLTEYGKLNEQKYQISSTTDCHPFKSSEFIEKESKLFLARILTENGI